MAMEYNKQHERSSVIGSAGDDRENPSKRRPRIIKSEDTVLDRSCSSYLIKGLLERGDFAVVGGAVGAGKTFFAMKVAYSMASGTPILGCRVRQTNVLYLTLEGHAGFQRRVYAHEQFYPKAPLYQLCCTLADLQDGEYEEGVLQQIKDSAISVVFVDTLARFLGESDENANAGMAKAIAFADRINRRTGAATMFIAHTGKDDTKGLRGHSSLPAALDLELMVHGTGNDERIVTLSKVKDGPIGARFTFDLNIIDLGMDDEGDQITTCVATDPVKVQDLSAGKRLTATEQKWYQGIANALSEIGTLRKVTPESEREYVACLVPDIEGCLQLSGVCPAPLVSGDTPETDEERAKRERQNSKDLSKWAGALRRKGKIGYENGLIWLLEGAHCHPS